MQEQRNQNQTLISTVIAILLFLLVIEGAVLILKKPASSSKHDQTAPVQETSSGLPAKLSQHTGFPSNHPAFSGFSPYAQRSKTYAAPTRAHEGLDDAFAAMQRLQDRMNQMFDTALMSGAPTGWNPMTGNQDEDFGGFAPAVDIQDDGKNYVVKSDMPGLDKDKINITVTGTLLSIEGKRENVQEKKDAQGFVTQERSYGSFARALNLPGLVDDSKIQADYKNGVLTIVLPKAAEKAQQKVAVQ